MPHALEAREHALHKPRLRPLLRLRPLVGVQHLFQHVVEGLHVLQEGIRALIAPTIREALQELQEGPGHLGEQPRIVLGQPFQKLRIRQRVAHGCCGQFLMGLTHRVAVLGGKAVSVALASHLVFKAGIQIRVRLPQVVNPLVRSR